MSLGSFSRVALVATLALVVPVSAYATDPQAIGQSCPTNGVVAGPNLSGFPVVCTSGTWALAAGVWSLNGSSFYYNGGNVGIGTTSPSYALDINSTGGIGARIVNTSSTGYANFDAQDNVGTTIQIGQEGGSTTGGNRGAILENGSEVMTFSTGGNVGIGQVSPGGRLEVDQSVSNNNLYIVGGKNFIQPSTSSADQGLEIDETNLYAGSNALFFTAPSGWTGHFISANLNNVAKFYVDQVGNVYSATNSFTSDIRLKKDIRPVDHALEKLAQIQGVTFHWKDPAQAQAEQIGIIAQNVEKVFPQVVTSGLNGFKAVNYSGLIAPLIEAIKELKALFDGDHADIANLKADNDNLRAANENEAAQLKALAARLDKLEAARR